MEREDIVEMIRYKITLYLNEDLFDEDFDFEGLQDYILDNTKAIAVDTFHYVSAEYEVLEVTQYLVFSLKEELTKAFEDFKKLN